MARQRDTTRRASVRARTGALAAALALTLGAGTAVASDTLPWTGESAVGANQPYQHGYSSTDLLRWNPADDTDAELLRAKVPLQTRIAPDATTQRNPALPADTQQLTLAGDYGNAFFESHPYTNEFSQYLFNYWQYSDVYASWHGMPTEGVPVNYYDPNLDWKEKWFEFGAVNLPNPGYTNAAHANGVRSLGCIFFSPNDRGDQTYSELLVRDTAGNFPAAAKLVEVAKYYGFDGYFFNQEDAVAAADIPTFKRFLKQLRDGGLYVQWYDSIDNATGRVSYQNEFNSVNAPFVRDKAEGDVSDSVFLNYWWDKSKLTRSKTYAESLGLNPRKSVFAGVEAGMYQFDQPYNLDNNLGTDGAPMNAIATLGADFVSSDYANKTDDKAQSAVFDRERRWWTGSSQGSTTPEGSWKGISKYVAERSVIKGGTFATSFNTGHGLSTWSDGKLSNDAEWGNINLQDIPVTWQWWIDAASSPLKADFDYGPKYTPAGRFSYQKIGAYNGGSSLVLSGRLDSDNTVRLYKTDLSVKAGSSLSLTYNKPSADDDSQLRLALVLASDPSKVVQVPLSGSGKRTDGWTTVSADLSKYAGEHIASLGLVVAAGAQPIENYQVNLGALALHDGVDRTPAKPEKLRIDQLLPNSDELFLSWQRSDYDTVRRYDVYLDDTYLGGIYDDVYYVKRFTATSGTIKLVAVGPDGSRSKPATVSFDLSSAPADVTAKASSDGTLKATWSPRQTGRPLTVEVRSLDTANPFTKKVTVPGQQTSTTLTGVPVSGDEYLLTAETENGTDGTATGVRGTFADTEISPYPATAVKISGNTFTFSRPTLPDWHTLTVLEDGQPKSFATTYGSGSKPYIVRGRTTRPAMTVTMAGSTSKVVAVLEDYAGNKVTTVLRGN
ncbi:endo-beta-N-acetylglucosaminidase family protein [Streptomyces bingchenggensis BCW-1]|uniref:Endo-beta-N-acetylglucosaminidase family protein n=1 Tax=Streptomyces bingchenggensis (strain BCW-1) TaxID=749414 RepID=D7C4C7_STRBB|nr:MULTISPECIES: endo-beta-N-acetylglucosaminidase [Streptomyces]ADI03949.1 endo-beta-N-acetylglucosaminidase family protein [Streptomyces bingchenggensis BCW-1]